MILFLFQIDGNVVVIQAIFSVIFALYFFLFGFLTLNSEHNATKPDHKEIRKGLTAIAIGVLFIVLGLPAWIGAFIGLLMWAVKLVVTSVNELKH